MDIFTQAVEDTASLHLKAADGSYLYDADKNPCRIVLYGPGSDAYARVEARQTQRALRRREDNDGKITMAPPEQRRTETAEDLAELTAAFEHFTYSPAGNQSGQALYQAFYADQRLGYIVEQVAKFAGNWAAFKSGSSVS